MATKKITLNELRSLVKQIIKEEENEKQISIVLTTRELQGLMYGLQQSDVMDIISKRREMNTPIARGFITGKSKLEDALKGIRYDDSLM
jgi:hypothetical protein